MKQCDICNEGVVTPKCTTSLYTYKGVSAQLPSHYLECDVCKSEYAGMVESLKNKSVVEVFRRGVDNLNSSTGM